MQIVRILNNNVVHAYNDSHDEIIIMGKGIAFNAKQNKIDESKIEKTFYLKSNELNSYMEKMLCEIPEEYWLFAGHIINFLKERVQLDVSVSFMISLIDHIYVSISRYRNGKTLPDIFSLETKYAYPELYVVAKEIVKEINSYFNINLSSSEAGYIALHLIDAEVEKGDDLSSAITLLISKVVTIVDKYFGKEIDKESDNYNRFLIHMKYFAQRVLTKEINKTEDKFIMIYQALSADCPMQQECVVEIKNMIRKDYLFLIGEDEMSYLLIYLIKVTVK